jgi:hypothetical protein
MRSELKFVEGRELNVFGAIPVEALEHNITIFNV